MATNTKATPKVRRRGARPSSPTIAGPDLVGHVEFFRSDANRFISDATRTELGQFLTPAPVSKFMAALSEPATDDIAFLDPGAGVGGLTAAWVDELLKRKTRPRAIHVTVCEIDRQLLPYLRQTITGCRKACLDRGVTFESEIFEGDFLTTAIEWLQPQSLFGHRGVPSIASY